MSIYKLRVFVSRNLQLRRIRVPLVKALHLMQFDIDVTIFTLTGAIGQQADLALGLVLQLLACCLTI